MSIGERIACEACGELAANGRDPGAIAALRDETTAVFQSLRAKPWLERAEALGSVVPA